MLCLVGLALPVVVSPSWFNAIGLVIIALLGIPHGALDLEIAKRDTSLSTPLFLTAYLGVMGLLLLLWMYLPLVSLLLFLVVSAYHFGQSQLIDLDLGSPIAKTSAYVLWGAFIFSSLFVFHLEELRALMASYADFAQFESILASPWLGHIAVLSGVAIISILCWHARLGAITPERLLLETAVLACALVSFYFLPLVLSFLLYFCIMHSARVMLQEKDDLQRSRTVAGWWEFIRLLGPMTIISLLGVALLAVLTWVGIISVSPIMTVLVLTSLVTLPHCAVMELFYISRAKKLTLGEDG